MKTKIHGYSVYVCKAELEYLQKHHPCLLSQAYSYGYEHTERDHHFYNQPKILKNNLKYAIRKKYQPYLD